jgi:PAT family beta-lactamase induction signal transducer AmpG
MLRNGYVAPFKEFFDRYGRTALIILALVATYRISDIVMGVVANVFYLDMGYTKTQIAEISKVYGLMATLAGGFLGGLIAVRIGVMKTLWLGAFLAAGTNVLFAFLAAAGEPDRMGLIMVVVADNASAGIASVAFVAWLSSLTNIEFTATQYALFSSIMTLFPKVLGGYSGTMVDQVGYSTFFIGTAILGIPVLALITWVGLRQRSNQPAA